MPKFLLDAKKDKTNVHEIGIENIVIRKHFNTLKELIEKYVQPKEKKSKIFLSNLQGSQVKKIHRTQHFKMTESFSVINKINKKYISC